MSWDRKRRGSATGYYYRSVRTPDGCVKKIYLGRGTRAKQTAAAVELRRQIRVREKRLINREADAIAEAEQFAHELGEWARLLLATWLVETGHHLHRGQWRLRNG